LIPGLRKQTFHHVVEAESGGVDHHRAARNLKR
jgi:hypothetical protein